MKTPLKFNIFKSGVWWLPVMQNLQWFCWLVGIQNAARTHKHIMYTQCNAMHIAISLDLLLNRINDQNILNAFKYEWIWNMWENDWNKETEREKMIMIQFYIPGSNTFTFKTGVAVSTVYFLWSVDQNWWQKVQICDV